MPAQHPQDTPPDGKKIVAGHLARFFKSAALAPSFRELDASALSTAEGFRVYTVSLDALLKGRPLASAEKRKWRYLVRQGEQTVAEVDVEYGGGQGPPRVVGVHRGPRAQAMDKALATAEEATRDRAFELRGLEAPALHFVALWLHGHGREGDIVIPIEPNRTSLANDQPHTEEEIIGTLEAAAAALQAAEASVSGPAGG